MKKLCLLLLLHAVALGSFAQNKKPQTLPATVVNPATDQQNQGGYTVVLRPAIRNTFLFAIYKEGKLVHKQARHSQTQQATGYADRKTAYEAAGRWIAAFQKQGAVPALMPAHIPASRRQQSQLLY